MSDERYSRQILFAPIGPAGQAAIARASVALVGCGALGSTLANAMVRAGVGQLTLIDGDRLELSNLQRQTLYDQAQVAAGLPKAEAARQRLVQINDQVRLEVRIERLDRTNIAELIGRPDLVLDGTDNFPTRYLLNDYCQREGLPWIYGGCAASYGVVMPIVPGRTPCLRCIFPDPPPPDQAATADTVGIIGPIAHAIASVQGGEAMKILSGHPEAIRPVLHTLDLWQSQLASVRLPPAEADCICCGQHRYEYLEAP